MEIAGKPIIHHVIRACRYFDTIVAVPDGDKDLINCIGDKARVIEGSELDVAERFARVLREVRPDRFIRICADSPMLTPEAIVCCKPYADMTWPVRVTDGPSGSLAELVDTFDYLFYRPQFSRDDREHVTSFFHRNDMAEKGDKYDGVSHTVDTQEDFDRVRGVMECGR
jgi:spore coat polysaccharide biosynthesis protein SpsF (cytidylyltransferase family)